MSVGRGVFVAMAPSVGVTLAGSGADAVHAIKSAHALAAKMRNNVRMVTASEKYWTLEIRNWKLESSIQLPTSNV